MQKKINSFCVQGSATGENQGSDSLWGSKGNGMEGFVCGGEGLNKYDELNINFFSLYSIFPGCSVVA